MVYHFVHESVGHKPGGEGVGFVHSGWTFDIVLDGDGDFEELGKGAIGDGFRRNSESAQDLGEGKWEVG